MLQSRAWIPSSTARCGATIKKNLSPYMFDMITETEGTGWMKRDAEGKQKISG